MDQNLIDAVNQPGRIGLLATVDAQGQPNIAYTGSARALPGNQFLVGLGSNRTLTNLEQNPNAVFLALKESPVTFSTPGWRLYLRLKTIDRNGEMFAAIQKAIAEKAGAKAAEMIKAALLFDVSEVRPLVD